MVFGDLVFLFLLFICLFVLEFELVLGNIIYVVEFDDVNRVLGNFFIVSFMIVFVVFFINIFVFILDFNLYNVKEDEERL